MIAIVDYGMGNVGSIQNMLKKVGEREAIITDDVDEVMRADGIILPGVGAYDMGVSALHSKGLFDCIQTAGIKYNKPILGICLGMQLLGKRSEEGEMQGLGLIDFECKRFTFDKEKLCIPHMGWDYVNVINPCHLCDSNKDEQRYYFVHSYMANCNDERDIFMTCTYGTEFVAAVHRENIYGVQFHPEKSHKYGMNLMNRFVEVCHGLY